MRKVVLALLLALLATALLFAIAPLRAIPHSPATANVPSQTVLRVQVHVVQRINQLDPAQYASSQEFRVWAYSACSAAAMTEVLNYYGGARQYRITNILHVEIAQGVITPQLGLLTGAGIAATVAQFGFTTRYLHNEMLSDVIALAKQGTPVIVSFPPDRYPGGHLLIVTGGTSSLVFLADSSRYNRQTLTHTQFLAWWEGFAAVVTPASKGGQA